MRKSMIASLVLLVGALLLQGCPPVTPVAPETTDQVAAVADIVPTTTGEFVFTLDLGIDQVEKGYGPVDIVGQMKRMAAKLEVELFYLNGELYKRFEADVLGGKAVCVCPEVFNGEYQIVATLRDTGTYQLFWGDGFVTVNGGTINQTTVTIRPLAAYLFYFILPGLPGTYGTAPEINRHTAIVEADGRVSQAWWDYMKDSTVFTAALPLDFKGGKMTVTDSNGKQHEATVPAIPAMTDWSKFYFGEVFMVNSSSSLEVSVQVDMTGYESDPVDENGKKLPTLKLTTATDGTVNVVFSKGDYDCADGVWYPESHSGYYDGAFVVSYLVDGEYQTVYTAVPNKAFNIPTPDSISWGWNIYQDGNNEWTQSFDDSIVVVTYDGFLMSYQDYVWSFFRG